MNLSRRVAKLESHVVSTAAPCHECGHPLDSMAISPSTVLAVSFAGDDDEPEYCTACGRQLVLVLDCDDRS